MTSSSRRHIDVVILGGGGHAKVLLDCIHLVEPTWSVAVLDSKPGLQGSTLLGAPVLGGDELLPRLLDANPGLRFAVGVGAARCTRLRATLFENALSTGAVALTPIHPSACVSRWAVIEEGAQVLAGAIVNAGARIGANAIVNTRAVVEHDCLVGRHVHVATGACLAGGVEVGQGAMVGAGSVVRQCLRVGAAAVVGAGAAVVADVPDGVTVVGVPAKALRLRAKNAE